MSNGIIYHVRLSFHHEVFFSFCHCRIALIVALILDPAFGAVPCETLSEKLKSDYQLCKSSEVEAEATLRKTLEQHCEKDSDNTGVLVACLAIFGVGVGFSSYLGYLEKRGSPMFGPPPQPTVKEGELSVI